jgi:glycosyltransferase involved in cell wall biosynthesis
MPARPAVSVVIPAFNAAAFIAETLESVFQQTFSGAQTIVVNDGSPDTPALESALAPYRDRILYIELPENRGPSGARNIAIAHATGEFIALLDSDDTWQPDYLAHQMDRLQADPTIDLIYADGVIVGGSLDGRRLMQVTPSHPHVTLERLIAEECVVLTSCTVARRQALLDAGLFDERFRRSEDAHLWLRIAMRGGRIVWHPDVLVRHRRRAGSLGDDTNAMRQAYIDVLEDLGRRFTFTPTQQALMRRQADHRRALLALDEGKQLLISGHYAQAAAAISRARQCEPAPLRQMRLGLLHAAVRLAPRLLHRAYERLRPSAMPALHG